MSAWGASKFRPAYLQLGPLRAVLGEAKALALTATAAKPTQDEIARSLNLINHVIVKESPDR